ncbi:MAG: peptidylprolyl isomerase [Chitinophagaceae bacterium]|nr:peptidylprolyl isomerase [Chitinophagaceae bacterium]
MQQAKKGDKVRVHYHGKLTDGTSFDSSEGRDPLEFTIGSGMVIPGFDDGVTGMSIGEKRTVTIPSDQAYGAKREELIMEFPVAQFPPEINPEPGMVLNMSTDQGQTFPVTVIAVENGSAIIDANAPLAGEDLVFDLELVEIVYSKPTIIMP